jgi:hypothetical protein
VSPYLKNRDGQCKDFTEKLPWMRRLFHVLPPLPPDP